MFITLRSAIEASQSLTAIPTSLWNAYLNFPKFTGCLAGMKSSANLLHKKAKPVWGMMRNLVWLEQRAGERKFRI